MRVSRGGGWGVRTDCSARSFGLEATVTLGALCIVEASFMKRDREDVFTSKILRLDCSVVFFSRFIAMGYPICPSPTNPYLTAPVVEEYPLHPPTTRPVTVRPILNCNMSCAKLVDVEVFGEAGPGPGNFCGRVRGTCSISPRSTDFVGALSIKLAT